MEMNKRPERKSVSNESLMLMGVPKHLCKKELADFLTEDSKGLKNVKKFVESYISSIDENIEENRGIFFYGSNGVGKSMLSCIILKEAYRKRYTCRRVTFSSYIGFITDLWKVEAKKEKDADAGEIYDKYKGVEFLVLEEIGKEIDSKIAKPILEELLRYREEKGLVTIICSNLSIENLEENYGPSILSLIKGITTPVKIVGVDKRREVFNNVV